MGDEELKRIFEASPSTRRTEWALLIVSSFLLFVILAAGGYVFVFLALDRLPPRFAFWWFLDPGAPLGVSLIIAWLRSRSLRFSLALDETCVQGGSFCLNYNDVDQVSLDVLTLGVNSPAIEIIGRGQRVCARIGKEERVECAAILHQRCPDAIMVDAIGNEFMPDAPADPARVDRVALSRFRKKALNFSIAAVFFGVLSACVGYAALHGTLMDWYMFGVYLVSASFLGAKAMDYYKKARRMQESLDHLQKQSGERQGL
jgi:hypothetical protein